MAHAANVLAGTKSHARSTSHSQRLLAKLHQYLSVTSVSSADCCLCCPLHHRLPASTSTSSAKSSPVAPTKVSRGCRSTASLHVARDLHNSPAATAVASGLRGSCCTAASNPAAARVNFDFGTSSKGSTSSSCSGNDAAMDGADSVCTVSSSGSRSGHTSNRAAAPSAGSQEDSQAQQQAAPKPTAVRPCGCKSLGVSFDCGSLSKGQEHQPLGTSPCAAALKAAAATAGANQNVRLPRPQQQQQRATAPGMSQCDQDCSATTAANASSTPHSGVLPQQLQLSPALSEPMLVDVHTPFEHPASKSQVDNSSGSCCCCTGGQRSSQSGTCSTAAAAAAAAANAHPLAWPLGVPVAAAAGFSQQQREQARHGTQGACAQGLAVPAGAHSAPANTGDLQALLATGHQPRSLGTLAAPSGARRVVQLGRATSTAAAASSSSGTKGVAAAAVTKAPGPQKPPLLKSSSIAVPPGQAVAAATSPKPLLPSPPKPALLLQRLRSLGHAHKEPSSAGGFPAWNRRHSVDLAAGNPGATAAVSSAPSGSSDPAVVTDPQPGAAAAAAALPDLVTPPRSKARPPAAAGMASPLAALCRLGGLLTNPTAAGSAATVAAAKRHNSCCSETSRDRSCDPGSLVQAGSSAAQRSSPGAAAGAAGLLVGLAGCEAGVVSDGAGYMRDAVPCGQTSPPQPCRSAKGVCMKVSPYGLNTTRIGCVSFQAFSERYCGVWVCSVVVWVGQAVAFVFWDSVLTHNRLLLGSVHKITADTNTCSASAAHLPSSLSADAGPCAEAPPTGVERPGKKCRQHGSPGSAIWWACRQHDCLRQQVTNCPFRKAGANTSYLRPHELQFILGLCVFVSVKQPCWCGHFNSSARQLVGQCVLDDCLLVLW